MWLSKQAGPQEDEVWKISLEYHTKSIKNYNPVSALVHYKQQKSNVRDISIFRIA